MPQRTHWFLLLLFFVATSWYISGLSWGLPSRQSDRYLFASESPWSGETIARLAQAQSWSHPQRGADVDANPGQTGEGLARLTQNTAQRAEILIRYRLYSYQPDEMVVFRAIAQMRPEAWDFDPRLYQYGGLFLYPIAALLKAASWLGAIVLRKEVAFYLDHPEEFARFYLVARGYVTLFALLGVWGVYYLGCRLAGPRAGLLAATLVAFAPITVNMAHEAKPHLPAATLMVWACYFALGYCARPCWRAILLTGVFCGLAPGMVLSAGVILLLLPMVVLCTRYKMGETICADEQTNDRREACPTDAHCLSWQRRLCHLLAAVSVSGLVFGLTNPYLVRHLLGSGVAMQSNLANSAAMYQIGDSWGGLATVIWLTAEAIGPLALIAVSLLILGGLLRRVLQDLGWRKWHGPPTISLAGAMILLPAVSLLIVMVLTGSGKPGEFARFGIFADWVLLLLLASFMARCWRQRTNWRPWLAVATSLLLAGTLVDGWAYQHNFLADSGSAHSRRRAADWLAQRLAATPAATVALSHDPAPYCLPPLDLLHTHLVKFSQAGALSDEWIVEVADHAARSREVAVYAFVGFELVFESHALAAPLWSPHHWWRPPTEISWANKPVRIYRRGSRKK